MNVASIESQMALQNEVPSPAIDASNSEVTSSPSRKRCAWLRSVWRDVMERFTAILDCCTNCDADNEPEPSGNVADTDICDCCWSGECDGGDDGYVGREDRSHGDISSNAGYSSGRVGHGSSHWGIGGFGSDYCSSSGFGSGDCGGGSGFGGGDSGGGCGGGDSGGGCGGGDSGGGCGM